MRFANKKDIKKLSLLRIQQQREDWKNEFEDKNDLLNITKEYFNKHLNNDLIVFVEEIGKHIIATCCLQIIEYLPQCNDNGKQGYICNVYTQKEYRNQGIQSKLLSEVINYSIENNLCELDLSTDSETAISLYKKHGFEFDKWAMKKEIKEDYKE